MSAEFSKEFLLGVKEWLSDPVIYEEDHGICWNLAMGTDTCGLGWAGDWVSMAAEDWSHHSGWSQYPIPTPIGWIHDGNLGDPQDYYNHSRNMWEGQQGEMRRSLIAYLLEYVTEQLQQYPYDP